MAKHPTKGSGCEVLEPVVPSEAGIQPHPGSAGAADGRGRHEAGLTP